MKKKILFSLLLVFAFFSYPNTIFAQENIIGKKCQVHPDCNPSSYQEYECQTSNIQAAENKFCTCKYSTACAATYGGVAGDWTCSSGNNLSYNLNFCTRKTDGVSFIPIDPNQKASIEQPTPPKSPPRYTKPMLLVLGAVCNLSDVTFAPGKASNIPWISECVVGIYKKMLVLGVIFSILFIVVGGVQYIVSAGNSGVVSKAKDTMTKSILGLLLLICSYIILYTINPEISNLKSINITSVDSLPLQENETQDLADADSGGPTTPTPPPEPVVCGGSTCVADTYCNDDPLDPQCLPKKEAPEACTDNKECKSNQCENNVCVAITALPTGDAPTALCNSVESCKKYCDLPKSEWPTKTNGMADPSQVTKGVTGTGLSIPSYVEIPNNLIAPLKAAGITAQNYSGGPYILKVESGYRSLKRQLEIACDNIKNKGGSGLGSIVAFPGGSLHGAGRALDIRLLKNGKSITTMSDDDQGQPQYAEGARILADIMYSNGWSRYLKEIWHFEYGGPTTCRTNSCYVATPKCSCPS